MKNQSTSKTDFTLISGGQPVAAPEHPQTKAEKLSQEGIDLQYLEHNLKAYCLAVANLEMILVATMHLRINNFDDSKLAGRKIIIPMPNGRNFVHTLGKHPTTEIKEWVKESKGHIPKLLDAPSQSIKNLQAAKDSIGKITADVTLGFALCYGRAHYLDQAERYLFKIAPQYTGHLFDAAQDWIGASAKSLGFDNANIETLKKSVYTDVDYGILFLGQAMAAVRAHKGVLKHLRREMDLRQNLMQAQEACLKAGLHPT